MRAYWGQDNSLATQGSIGRYLTLLPRGSLKSTIVTISFTIWILIQNDPKLIVGDDTGHWEPPKSFNGKKGYNQRILIGQEVEKKVVNFHKAIQEHFESNEELIRLFGEMAPQRKTDNRWTRTESDIMTRSDYGAKEANITVCSLEGSINSAHHDIGIFDDIFSEKQVTNEEMIETTKEFYRRSIPVLEKPSLCFYVGTRWDDRDLYGYFIEEEADKWNIYIERAEREDEEIRRRWPECEDLEEHRFFFPQRQGRIVLDDVKGSMLPYLYSGQYLNDPIDQETAVFKKEYFDEDTFFDLPEGGFKLEAFLHGKTIFTTADPALADEKRSCHAAVVTWAWGQDGKLYLLDAFRQKGVQPSSFIEVLWDHNRKWRPLLIGMEDEGLQKVFSHFGRRMSEESGIFPPMTGLSPRGRSKDYRIKGLEPYARAKRIRFQRGNALHMAILDEFLRYPKGQYKDALDATAYQLDLAFSPTEEEVQAKKEPGVTESELQQELALFDKELTSGNHSTISSGRFPGWYQI